MSRDMGHPCHWKWNKIGIQMAANKIITMLQTQQNSQFFPKLFKVADCDGKTSHIWDYLYCIPSTIYQLNNCEKCWQNLLGHLIYEITTDIIYIVYQVQSANLIVVKNIGENLLVHLIYW